MISLERVKDIAAISCPWLGSLSASMLAWYSQNSSLKIRWLMGYGYSIIGLTFIIRKLMVPRLKQTLPSVLTDSHATLWWGFMNGFWAMTGTQGVTQIFGGKKYYDKHNIKSLKQALIAAMSPTSIYYKSDEQTKDLYSENDNKLYENIKLLMRFVMLYAVGRKISKYLKSNPDLMYKIENEWNAIISIEIAGFLYSIASVIPNIPAIMISIGAASVFGEMDNISKMVPPFDWVYFGNSFRWHWKNWSVPAGEMLRYAIYEPLGGRDNLMISVPVLFAFNNTLHWDWTYNMYGYRAIEDWTKVFVLLGLCVTAEITIETKTDKIYNDSLWYKTGSFVAYHAALVTVIYILKRKASIWRLESVCDTLLVDRLLWK